MKIRVGFSLVLVLSLSGVLLAGAAGGYDVPWHVLGGGGGSSSGGDYALDGTLGQPVAGRVVSTAYALESGYWTGAIVATATPTSTSTSTPTPTSTSTPTPTFTPTSPTSTPTSTSTPTPYYGVYVPLIVRGYE